MLVKVPLTENPCASYCVRPQLATKYYSVEFIIMREYRFLFYLCFYMQNLYHALSCERILFYYTYNKIVAKKK